MAMRIFNQRFGMARPLRAILLASSALCMAPFLAALPAAAQDATWLANPGSGNFNDAANWTPATVPGGTAFFGTSSVTALSFSASATFGGFTFNSGASAYNFNNTQNININGAGIVINGGSVSIDNNFIIFFQNSSTAGNATIINNFFMEMLNSSTLGNANFIQSTNGLIQLFDSSSAGSATITNHGTLEFWTNATGGTALSLTVPRGS
jgi:hypothetical protein